MKKITFTISVILLLVSCAKEKNSLEFTIESTTDISSNEEGLSFVNEKIEDIMFYQTNRGSMQSIKAYATYDSVVIADEIAKLFNPDNFECPLPKKLKEKLKKVSWAPSFVVSKVRGLPKYALHMDEASLSVLLNSITLKKSDGKENSIVVLGAPSYSNLNVQNYLDTEREEFTYSLDISGYLSAALSTSANVGENEISQSAKLSLDKSGMLMLARGHIFSPLYAALRPGSFPDNIKQNDYHRLTTLFSIIEALPQNTNENDTIITPMELDVIWSSTSGNSNFNGEGTLKTNVGGSIGVVSASFNSEGSASFLKQTTFKEFDTYIINSEVLTNYDPITIKEINNTIKHLTSMAVIEKPCEVINGKINFTIRFPKGYKNIDWSVNEQSYSIDKIEIDGSNFCAFTVSGPSDNLNKIITLHSSYRGIELMRKIALQ